MYKIYKVLYKVNSDFADAAYLTYPLIVVEGDLKENMFGGTINENIIDLLGIDFMEKEIKDNPINLSYGQQQKVNLLRVLSSNKSLIVLDEPLTSLDERTQANIINYIKDLKGKMTIIIIMHSSDLDDDADLILEISNKQLRFSN